MNKPLLFEDVREGQNFLAENPLNPNQKDWYRKQTATTAIRSTDNALAVLYPKDPITTVGKGVPSQPFLSINNPHIKVVLLNNIHNHWQEFTMREAANYIAVNNLPPMTPAHQVRSKSRAS